MYELYVKVVNEGICQSFGTFPTIDDAVGFAHTMSVFGDLSYTVRYGDACLEAGAFVGNVS